MMNTEELTLIKSLCKDSERLSKARGVLREYEELIENIKKGAWLTQEDFINATSALHKLADALESEAECVVLEPLAPSYCLPEVDNKQSLVCEVFEIGSSENTEPGECEVKMICSADDVKQFPNVLYQKVSLTLIESEAE